MKAILTILVSAVITLGLRAFPFLVYRGDRQMPQMLKDLGNVLPAAIMAVLVVYCLKDVPGSGTYGLPEAIAILFIVFLHNWKKNTLLSIGGGTVLYMLLVQMVF